MHVHRLSTSDLPEYSGVGISFQVASVLDVYPDATGDFELTERGVASPYIKDYDSVPESRPTSWPPRFDLAGWGLFGVRSSGVLVGGAAVAPPSEAVSSVLEPGNAVLFDLRVAPQARRHGVGKALFASSAAWAREHGARHLITETQNTNVPACRFYQGLGCVLLSANSSAYPDLPDETELVWSYHLGETAA